jgi:hypothetical protein
VEEDPILLLQHNGLKLEEVLLLPQYNGLKVDELLLPDNRSHPMLTTHGDGLKLDLPPTLLLYQRKTGKLTWTKLKKNFVGRLMSSIVVRREHSRRSAFVEPKSEDSQ